MAHDLGSNWELVSDAINNSLHFKVWWCSNAYTCFCFLCSLFLFLSFVFFVIFVFDAVCNGLLYHLKSYMNQVKFVCDQCIFRKAKECKERHNILTERTSGDGADSAEDSGSSQPYPPTLPGIPQVKMLFSGFFTIF